MLQLQSWLARRDVRRWLGLAALVLIAALSGRGPGGSRMPGPSGPAGGVEGHPRLVDGDSFHLGQGEVRLKGIDAPEGRQICQRDGRPWSCGEAARAELQRLIGSDKVVCTSVERDQHNRLLGYCTAGTRDLNAGMVASGMAVAFGGYIKEEMAAKLARRGLWGSQFQRPRDWRHEHGIGGHAGL